MGLQATGIGVMPGSGKSCISAVAAERAAALDHIKWLVDCTHTLGGKLCLGPFHQSVDEFSGLPPQADELSHLTVVHKAATQYAASAGITLAVAPLNRELRCAGYDGWLTVEAFGSALPDLAAATRILRPLLDSPDAVHKGAYRRMRDGYDHAG